MFAWTESLTLQSPGTPVSAAAAKAMARVRVAPLAASCGRPVSPVEILGRLSSSSSLPRSPGGAA